MANLPTSLHVDVVNAESSVFSGEATYVGLPGQEGSLGVLPGHLPFITKIRPGEVVIRTKTGDDHVFVAGGILEVQPDRVTVLADTAIRSKDLDEAKAIQALEDAKRNLENAKSDREMAQLQAAMSALTAQISFIRNLRR